MDSIDNKIRSLEKNMGHNNTGHNRDNPNNRNNKNRSGNNKNPNKNKSYGSDYQNALWSAISSSDLWSSPDCDNCGNNYYEMNDYHKSEQECENQDFQNYENCENYLSNASSFQSLCKKINGENMKTLVHIDNIELMMDTIQKNFSNSKDIIFIADNVQIKLCDVVISFWSQICSDSKNIVGNIDIYNTANHCLYGGIVHKNKIKLSNRPIIPLGISFEATIIIKLTTIQ